MSKKDALARSAELLEMVGIPDGEARLREYPHQFLGGMRQRVMIAMAMSCEPSVLIADEPTTALDVTIQAQIVELVKELRDRSGVAVIWITHDLSVVAGIADRVIVMYAGYIVKEAPVDALFEDPRHPYTVGLLGALPSLGGGSGHAPDDDRRFAAGSGRASLILPVPHTLPLCDRTLPQRKPDAGAGCGRQRPGPSRGLLGRHSRGNGTVRRDQ